jgi:predicted acyl esterase
LSRNDAVTAGERPARIPAKVRTIEHTWIPMPDGTRLAARIWLPEDAQPAPVPAILDFLVAVQATGHMTAGPATFLVTLGLDAREDGHRVHSRQWHLEFPRNGT